jgi:glycosyltransferase involved in cell wall biosynthesis
MNATQQRNGKRILEIGNWPPPVCSWSMSLVGLRKVLEARGWECRVMNLNENRRKPSSEYIDIQGAMDYMFKLFRCVNDGCAVHVRVNGEAIKGYLIAFLALLAARLWSRPALLTYGGGHQQTYFPAPRMSIRHFAFSLLFCLPARIYCNSEAVKRALLRTGIPSQRVLPIPHTSSEYAEFSPLPLPEGAEEFLACHDAVFFSYVCYRKEFVLDFLAEVIRRSRTIWPRIGFLLVGPWQRELGPMEDFLRAQGIRERVFLMGSVSHEMFLTLLSRSLAYIRTPITDGVCSSVLEAMALKIPVLASDNGTRPYGVELWRSGDPENLLSLMKRIVENRSEFVARIPDVILENNTVKLANDIEMLCLHRPLFAAPSTGASDSQQFGTLASREAGGQRHTSAEARMVVSEGLIE